MATEPTEAPLPSSKPAFLRRVQIRNYKSIAFCDVTLEPLTILVGRNATGKSNFLDALGFLRDVVVKGVREAVHLHGGRDAVLCRSATEPKVRIEIETFNDAEDKANSRSATLALEIELTSNGSAKLTDERLQVTNNDGQRIAGIEYLNGEVRWEIANNTVMTTEWSGDRSFLSSAGYTPGFAVLYFALSNVLFYNFNPDLMRLPQLLTSGEFLKPDGSNLASVYNSTLAADPAAAKRAGRYLNAVARSVEFVHALPAGGYEIMEFDTSGNVDDWNGPLRKADRFPAASMSDGTLRAFAAVMAAFQTIAPYGSPSLVAIEEPETALHPAAMRALVAAFDEATLRTQILITTHSPDLLDAEDVKPANVRVVEMVDGHTVIGPVDGASVENVRDDLATLGELERKRQLGADRDDLNRQAELAGRELTRS